MQDWLKRPIRDVHLTIRESDVIDFDVPGFIDDMERLHANIVTFYIGGYGAHYPTNVKDYPRNPYIGERDLVKEIDIQAHRRGMLIGTCIDAGTIVEEVAKAHPDWLAMDENGNPRVVTTQHGKVYSNCINTGYIRDVIPEILREHLTLHKVDLINLTDFSFHGFCHCANCRRDFKAETGHDIPAKPDWNSPVWQAFMNWRVKTLSAIWDRTFTLVKEISPNTATMGNNVLDLVNMRNSAHDLDFLKDVEDVIKTEAQTRVQYVDIDLPMKEEPFQWPAEEVRYLRTITRKPSLTSSNYGYTWPWRRAALPPRLQKLWLAEVIANGGNMFVHIGGQPAVQEDRRGLSAIEDMFGWVEKHEQYYQDARAYTDLAILLSQNTLLTYCGSDTESRYVNHLRGLYAALNQAHINFDILSEKFLTKEMLSKYRAIMLTNHACMSDAQARAIRDYVAGGGHVVATYESSLYDENGVERAFADRLRANTTAG